MTELVFVGADVLVHARDSRERGKQARAAAWLERLWRDRCGRTSVQVLAELYVTVKRRLRAPVDADDAWDDATALLAWQPQPIDEAVLRQARQIERRFRLSWWDAAVVTAAQLQDCEVLLTEDLQDGVVLDGLTIRSPFTLSAAEDRAGCAVPAAARLHRARGRRARPLTHNARSSARRG